MPVFSIFQKPEDFKSCPYQDWGSDDDQSALFFALLSYRQRLASLLAWVPGVPQEVLSWKDKAADDPLFLSRMISFENYWSIKDTDDSPQDSDQSLTEDLADVDPSLPAAIFVETSDEILADEAESSPSSVPLGSSLNEPETHEKRLRKESGLFFSTGAYYDLLDLLQRYDFGRAEIDAVAASFAKVPFRHAGLERMMSLVVEAELPNDEKDYLRHAHYTFQKASTAILTRYARLAQSIACKFARKSFSNSLSVDDLVQEGRLGLYRSLESYDVRRGFCFSTYASFWAEAYIRRALTSKAALVHVPKNGVRQIAKINAFICARKEETGEPPSVAEIAQTLSIPEPDVFALLHAKNMPISLNAPISSGNEDLEETRLSLLADETVMASDEQFFQDQRKKQLYRLLEKSLSPRELFIIDARFGLTTNRDQSLEEIGRRLGITRERIRQVEERALHKLKIRARNDPKLRDLYPSPD
jgi:RNA polymerase sigma factor (sigma-70 family)